MPNVDSVRGQEVVAGAAGILYSSLVCPSFAAILSVLRRLLLEVGQEEAAGLVFEFELELGPKDVGAEVVVGSYAFGRRAEDRGHIAVGRPL
jgi:hypothetical protein